MVFLPLNSKEVLIGEKHGHKELMMVRKIQMSLICSTKKTSQTEEDIRKQMRKRKEKPTPGSTMKMSSELERALRRVRALQKVSSLMRLLNVPEEETGPHGLVQVLVTLEQKRPLKSEIKLLTTFAFCMFNDIFKNFH